MNKIYMLHTNICSFIMREQPEAVLKRLEQTVLRLAAVAVLVTNNTREFERVPGLVLK